MKQTGDATVFAARRMTVGRCRRKFTKKMLAERIGVSAEAITLYEDEKLKPSRETVQRISIALQFPVSFFYAADVSLVGAEEVSFRARRSLKANIRDKALATGVIAIEIISPKLREGFKLPVLDLPDLSGENPETAARVLRVHWNLGAGPIYNMVHLLESRGIEVYWIDEPDSCLDAFSLWRGEQPYILLNSYKPAGDRARFDAAHELGHLVLHRQEKVIEGLRLEKEADAFASAFLLPAEQFRYESPKLPILNQYLPLKRRWRVSVQAMIRRGFDIGIFSEWYYERAIKELSVLGWRTKEPVDIVREHSQVHRIIFDHLASKQISPTEYAASLYLPNNDLIEIMPSLADFVPISTPRAEKEYVRGDVRLKLIG